MKFFLYLSKWINGEAKPREKGYVLKRVAALFTSSVAAIFLFFVTIIALFLLLIAGNKGSDNGSFTEAVFPEEVEAWRSVVVRECNKNEIPEAVDNILAIISVETGGNAISYPDIMQCSESQGKPPNSIKDPNESIRVGVKYFADMYKGSGKKDVWNVTQAYNYGGGYLSSSGDTYSFEAAKDFSFKKSGGVQVTYTNPIALAMGYSYRYNYGNMFYVPLCQQYFTSGGNGTGGTRSKFVEIATAQQGKPYVWGAEGPNSFDCSGLVMWALKQVGVSYPHYTGDQWNKVERISESQLKTGDLIFYGANASRHVSIYIGPNKTFEAKSPSQGIGYGTYKSANDVCGYGRIKELTDKASNGGGGNDKSWICPISNPTVTSEYGYRISPLGGGSELHNAIDLVNGNPNTPIFATMSGTVVEASGKYFGWYGNYVVIKHSNGKFSGYAHLSKINCKVGQKVKQGETIGLMGTTGPSTAPHLHFQIGTYTGGGGGNWENPRNYVKF